MSGVIERARGDIERGELWRARERLTMAAKQSPPRIDVLDLLGDLHFRMADPPSAWRYWCLTGKEGKEADEARSAFAARWGKNLGTTLKMIPFDGAIEHYPPVAQERIRDLRRQAERRGWEWPAEQPPEVDLPGPAAQGLVYLGCGALAVATVGIWVYGFIQLVQHVF